MFPGKTERGIFTYVIDAERNYLEKTAGEYHPTIASYIHSAKPIPGKTQILLTALGAGEYWGNNVNGDYFPEAALAHEGDDYGYKTFEKHAHVYKHHVNKNPAASYGRVPLAVYNPTFHRVELIVSIDNASAPEIVQRMDAGDYPDWSMGCKVPFDVCSICGNKAPTRAYYCEHLKYYMGRIHPETGKLAYAINTMPKFFDISYVLIGADRIAKALRKVASAPSQSSHVVGSALLADKVAEAAKAAEIRKEVPASEPPASQSNLENLDTLVRAIPVVKAQEPPLPSDVINRLSGEPLSRALSTMTMLGMVPKPQEFQKIFLISMGKRQLAEDLEQRNLCFDPMMADEPSKRDFDTIGCDHRNFDERIMQWLRPHIPDRSYAMPHLARRMAIIIKQGQEYPLPEFIKVSEEQKKERKPFGILPVLIAAATAYAALARKAPKESLGGIDKLLSTNAGLGLATALGIGLIGAFRGTIGANAKGNYAPGPYVNPDTNDVFTRIEALKQKPYLKVAGVSSLGSASKRLFFGVPAAYMASGVLQQHRKINPFDEESRVKSFIRQNPDVVSGALIADAVLSAKGHPMSTASLLSKGKGLAKGLGRFAKAAAAADELMGTDLLKTADVQDVLTNAVTWPLAIGKANLPGRIVGGLFDQAIIEGSSKAIDAYNRRKQSRNVVELRPKHREQHEPLLKAAESEERTR